MDSNDIIKKYHIKYEETPCNDNTEDVWSCLVFAGGSWSGVKWGSVRNSDFLTMLELWLSSNFTTSELARMIIR